MQSREQQVGVAPSSTNLPPAEARGTSARTHALGPSQSRQTWKNAAAQAPQSPRHNPARYLRNQCRSHTPTLQLASPGGQEQWPFLSRLQCVGSRCPLLLRSGHPLVTLMLYIVRCSKGEQYACLPVFQPTQAVVQSPTFQSRCCWCVPSHTHGQVGAGRALPHTIVP